MTKSEGNRLWNADDKRREREEKGWRGKNFYNSIMNFSSRRSWEIQLLKRKTDCATYREIVEYFLVSRISIFLSFFAFALSLQHGWMNSRASAGGFHNQSPSRHSQLLFFSTFHEFSRSREYKSKSNCTIQKQFAFVVWLSNHLKKLKKNKRNFLC